LVVADPAGRAGRPGRLDRAGRHRRLCRASSGGGVGIAIDRRQRVVFGARVSRTHAVVAAFVAAIWFEFVSFAPHTLSEPLATAIILPAALLLTQASLSQRHLAIAGASLAIAFVFRFQYAPAIAVLALGACWSHWRNLNPLPVGGF